MGMEDFDDIPPRPRDREVEFANGIALCFAAMTLVMNLRSRGAFSFVDIGIAIAFGIAVWGAVRAATIAIPAVATFFLNVKVEDKPDDKPEPPAVAQPTAVPPPVVNVDIETEEPLEIWEQALEDKLLDNDRFLALNGRQWAIPGTVGIDHLFLLAEARAAGKLRQFLSPNSLNDYANISRNGKAPNAQSLIDFLASIGAVKSNGERRPYSLTELGEKLFPDKLETPPPAPVNGVFNASRLLSD